MQIFTTVLLSAIAARDALASPIQARSPYVVKETHFAPREWTKLDRAHGGKTIQLQIGLKQGNFEELDRHLHEGMLFMSEKITVFLEQASRLGHMLTSNSL
jgi:tripeptidyl-peptidase-1